MPLTRTAIISLFTRVAVVIALLAVGIYIFYLLWMTRPQPSASPDAGDLTRVDVMQVQAVEVQRQFDGYGTAIAHRASNVPAQVRGVVVQLPDDIVEGRRIDRGELLVQLDESDYLREVEIRTEQIADTRAQLQQLDVEASSARRRVDLAQEEVDLAQADLQRVLQARETAGATQREVDQQRQAVAAARRALVAASEQLESITPRRAQLQAILDQQQASLRLAQRNLERTSITSPITGIIQSVDVDLGESVQADATIARIVDLRRVDVPLRLPSSARAHIGIGASVTLTTADSGLLRTARISRIAPEDDENARTMTAYVELLQDPDAQNNQPLVNPGQFLQARVSSVATQQRQVLPRSAVVGDRVRLVDNDGIVRSTRVEVDFSVQATFESLGLPDTHWLVLEEPLPPGTLVVLNASRRLSDGSAVQPINVTEHDDASAEQSP